MKVQKEKQGGAERSRP